MKYIISEEQLDKMVKSFLDKYFDDSEIMTSYYDNGNWFGIFSDGNLLIGHPANYDDNLWFYNGQIVGHGVDMFSLEPHEWANAIKRYMNKNYPQLNVGMVA